MLQGCLLKMAGSRGLSWLFWGLVGYSVGRGLTLLPSEVTF